MTTPAPNHCSLSSPSFRGVTDVKDSITQIRVVFKLSNRDALNPELAFISFLPASPVILIFGGSLNTAQKRSHGGLKRLFRRQYKLKADVLKAQKFPYAKYQAKMCLQQETPRSHRKGLDRRCLGQVTPRHLLSNGKPLLLSAGKC